MRNYRIITALLSPLVPLWLYLRRLQGKEDPKRLRERFGYASRKRPAGTLLWIHAASVGEANSVLMLIAGIRERFPKISILMTTGTLTSASLMQSRLPREIIHQYAPVDTLGATQRFMRQWKPDIGLIVESELWPNLITTARRYQCFLALINARMSERSFRSWQKRPVMIRELLGCFSAAFAQSPQDAERLRALGANNISCLGNLKFDAAILSCNEADLVRLQGIIGTRPLWLAASTHPGEEAIVASVHAQLMRTRPNLLTIIVPRHPQRGVAIAAELKARGKAALRSRGEVPDAGTTFYVADTLGELGLFYRLSEIVFMGGSLVKHGGQNPLEPARLACGILTGPHTYNFADIYDEMEKTGGCLRAKNAQHFMQQAELVFSDRAMLGAMQDNLRKWLENKGGATQRLLEALEPVLAL